MTIETKFNRGDMAWTMINNRPMQVKINDIYASLCGLSSHTPSIKYSLTYYDEQGSFHAVGLTNEKECIREHLLFDSKQELIESL